MKAFHGDLKVKEKYVSRVLQHFEADEIIRGQYWKDGRGCAVGCTLHSSDHSAYEGELGIPSWLAHLEDVIFEGLPLERAKQWPSEFLNVIHPGADLQKVKTPFLIFILEFVLPTFDHRAYPDIKYRIGSILHLLQNPVSTAQDFIEAEAAATWAARAAEAAARAGWAAAWAARAAEAAAGAGWAATWAARAAEAAAGAGWAAARAARAAEAAAGAGWAAARAGDTYTKFADKLLQLLRDCK